MFRYYRTRHRRQRWFLYLTCGFILIVLFIIGTIIAVVIITGNKNSKRNTASDPDSTTTSSQITSAATSTFVATTKTTSRLWTPSSDPENTSKSTLTLFLPTKTRPAESNAPTAAASPTTVDTKTKETTTKVTLAQTTTTVVTTKSSSLTTEKVTSSSGTASLISTTPFKTSESMLTTATASTSPISMKISPIYSTVTGTSSSTFRTAISAKTTAMVRTITASTGSTPSSNKSSTTVPTTASGKTASTTAATHTTITTATTKTTSTSRTDTPQTTSISKTSLKPSSTSSSVSVSTIASTTFAPATTASSTTSNTNTSPSAISSMTTESSSTVPTTTATSSAITNTVDTSDSMTKQTTIGRSISITTAHSSTISAATSTTKNTMTPAISSTMSKTVPTSTMGTTTATITHTLSSPSTSGPLPPCQANIVLLIDSSNALTDREFIQEILFINSTLIDSTWIFKDIALSEYAQGYTNLANFKDLHTYADFQSRMRIANHIATPISIALALNFTLFLSNSDAALSWKVILFASASDVTDVQNAIPFANQLKSIGNLIVVALGLNVNDTLLGELGTVITWPDYDNVPNNLARRIRSEMNCTVSTSSLAPSTSSATTSVTRSTRTSMPSSETTNLPSTKAHSTTIGASSDTTLTTTVSISTPSTSTHTSTSIGPTLSISVKTSPTSTKTTSEATLTTPNVTSTLTATLPPSTHSSTLATTVSPTKPSTGISSTMSTISTTQSGFQCPSNIVLLIDGSIGLSDSEFNKQKIFISSTLVDSTWPFSEMAVTEYAGNYIKFATFGEINDYTDFQSYMRSASHISTPANIAQGLNYTIYLPGELPQTAWQVILFSSTSDATDVQNALPYANHLRILGNMIVVATGVNVDHTLLGQLGTVVSWPDYNNVPNNLVNSIQSAMNCTLSTTSLAPSVTSSSRTMTTTAGKTTILSSMKTSSTSIGTRSETTLTTSIKTTEMLTQSNALSTTMSSTTGTPPTMISSTTQAMATTTKAEFQCQGNIVLLIDGSNGLNDQEFRQQIAFISPILVNSMWPFMDTAITQYAANYDKWADFGDLHDYQGFQAHLQHAYHASTLANIAKGLNYTIFLPNANPQIAWKIILFASTSDDADIQSAMPYANQLKSMGNIIIVAMGMNANYTKLGQLGTVVPWPDYANVPSNLADTIRLDMNCSVEATSSTALTTATTQPGFQCPVNIVLLIDGSNGLSDTQFGQQITFISPSLVNSTWPFMEIAITEYADADHVLAYFGDLHQYGDFQSHLQQAYHVSTPASIAKALDSTIHLQTSQPQAKWEVILFSSASDPADVQNALPFANQLKTMGNLIIVAMGGNVDANALGQLASANSIFLWPDFNNVPENLASDIMHAMHC